MLGFELRYHARQLTFIAAAVIFFAMGVLAVQGRFGSDDVHKNGPYVYTVLVGMLSLLSIFTATLFCAGVVLRDTANRMDAIVFSTAVRRLPFFTVRFAGLLLAALLMLVLAVTGMALATLLQNPEVLGPHRAAYIIQPLLVFGLPNVLFATSVIFCTALLTRNLKAVYAAGLLLYILYLTASILGNSPMIAGSNLKTGTDSLWPLLSDPFGLAALFGETRNWNDVQRNTQLFPLSGIFLWNRVIWTMISLLLLAVSYRYFNFRQPQPAALRRRSSAALRLATGYRAMQVHPQGYGYAAKAFRSQLGLDAQSLFRSIPFMVMLALWIFLYGIELKDSLFSGPMGIRAYPFTGIVIEELRPMRPAMLLIIFCAAELLWRERASGMHGLIYATPVPHALMWGAKCAALVLLIGVMIVANVAIGISLQLLNGFTTIEPLVYLQLVYYSGLPLLLFAVLAVLILTLTPNKYAGMLFCLVPAMIITFGKTLGLEHPMLRFGDVPELAWSYMNGFGHYREAFNWYMVYWGGLAVMFALLTIAVWPAVQRRWLQRMKAVPAQLGKRGFFIAGIAMLLTCAAGTYIFYETGFRSKAAKKEWRMAYERKYRPVADLPQPVIKAVKVAVDVYPANAWYRVKGSFLLKNETTSPLSKIWIDIDENIQTIQLHMPGVAKQEQDERFHQHWLHLEKPLQPGDTTHLDFAMEVSRNGFKTFNSEHTVVSNGTYIELEKYVPALGYDEGYELSGQLDRRQAGLPPRTDTPSTDDAYHLIDFAAVISTPANQQAITVGELQKTWIDGDRRYSDYKTRRPVNFMFAISAAEYAVHEEKYNGIRLRALYHPGHAGNLPAIIQGAKDALDYCHKNFGAYPLPYLHLAEIPHYKGAATAYPGLLFLAERILFLSNFSDSGRVNQAYAIAAHETAHQWWANMPAPVHGPGDAMLTESLAKYTEAMVMEKRFGKAYLSDYFRVDNHMYLVLRSMYGKELPLIQTNDQPFVHYQKGGMVLYRLKENLGETHVNRALQQLVAQHAWPGKKVRPADLLHALQTGADSGAMRLIDECLQQVVVYDLQIKSLGAARLPGGQYRLDLQVNIARKDAAGNPLPVDGRFDIGVLDKAGKLIYAQPHHFSNAETRLSLTVGKEPGAVAIDPYQYVLDENPANNKTGID